MMRNDYLFTKALLTLLGLLCLAISCFLSFTFTDDLRKLYLRWGGGTKLQAQVQCYESSNSISALHKQCLLSYEYEGKVYHHYVSQYGSSGNARTQVPANPRVFIRPEQPDFFYFPFVEGTWIPSNLIGIVLTFLFGVALLLTAYFREKKQVLGAAFEAPSGYQQLRAQVKGVQYRDFDYLQDTQYRIQLLLPQGQEVFSAWLPYEPSSYLPEELSVFIPPKGLSKKQTVLIDGSKLPEAHIY